MSPTPKNLLDRPEIPPLLILHRDADIAAISKPSGLVVHRSEFASDRINCISLLRKQLGLRVYPVHRLDRGASGLLLFALHPAAAGTLCRLFSERRVEKSYLALVRGYLPDEGLIDYPLADEPEKEPTQAQTQFRCLAQCDKCCLPVFALRKRAALEHPEPPGCGRTALVGRIDGALIGCGGLLSAPEPGQYIAHAYRIDRA